MKQCRKIDNYVNLCIHCEMNRKYFIIILISFNRFLTLKIRKLTLINNNYLYTYMFHSINIYFIKINEDKT